MFNTIKFIYFVLIQYFCNCEWIELTRIIDDSHKSPKYILSQSNFMQKIQPMVTLNPIIKNSYVLDEFLNSNLSNGKTKVQIVNNLPDTTVTSITSPTTLANEEQFRLVDEKCDNCTFSKIESFNLKPPNYNHIPKNSTNFENIFDFMLKIQKSFNATTQYGKINALNTLKSDLITNIEERLENVFPSSSKRRKRGIVTSEGHMDFPSAEGALITICFLTFAVFLIKLVLQVINTIKSKHYNYNGLDGMSPVKMMKSHKLGKSISPDNYDTEKILSSIYNYKTLK